LVRVELQTTIKSVGRDLVLVGVFGFIALLGLLPLVAFFVIGLGKLLGNNYWLSSLIVGVVCIVVGALVGYHYFNKIRKEDLSFCSTRESFQQLREVKENVQRRAS